PDSGVAAALGYSKQSGIDFELGIIRNHYVGRTFIEPTQQERELKVRLKLNPIRELIADKDIIVIDDSVVRGTTSRQIIRILRQAGARKIHLLISSPPTISPCFYGVDTPHKEQLICANKSIEDVRKYIGADSLGFLSIEGLVRSIGGENKSWCKACFDENYIDEYTRGL
ncbi:amidophosphoribosyltransferase, partial [uncultured Helicobacter sp.]